MSWAYTDTAGRTVSFDRCGDFSDDVHIRIQRPNVIICIPAHERHEAAQSMAGDGYRVVPNEGPTRGQVMEALGVNNVDEILPAIERLKTTANMPTWEREPLAGQDAQQEIDQLKREVAKLREHRDELRQRISDNAHARLYEAQAAQPDRPEPVDPASVKVGDVVEIEADDGSWMVRGECSEPLDNVGYLGLHIDSTRVVWISVIDGATVRVLHAAEPVPDEAAVEALADGLVDQYQTIQDGKWRDAARALIRDHGVHVEVSE